VERVGRRKRKRNGWGKREGNKYCLWEEIKQRSRVGQSFRFLTAKLDFAGKNENNAVMRREKRTKKKGKKEK
jgi:hypothetical protein